MNAGDIERMERELDVQLPECYRATMLSYPIRCFAGNDETEIWDNAGRLIEFNLDLRRGFNGNKPWPKHMFALGIDDGGSTSAIDVNQPKANVLWADRCQLDGLGSGFGNASFEVWSRSCFDELRVRLSESGIDPDSTPEERRRVEAANAKHGCRAMLVMIVLGFLGSLGIGLAFGWIRF